MRWLPDVTQVVELCPHLVDLSGHVLVVVYELFSPNGPPARRPCIRTLNARSTFLALRQCSSGSTERPADNKRTRSEE